MIRSAIFLLAGLCLANAKDTGECAINGARAVDDMLDAATYIWASMERCKDPKKDKNGNQILCAMDVSASIESVNAMVNVILKAVEDCEGLEGEHEKCGLAVGVLTRAFAGLAAGSAGVTAKCATKPPLVFLVTQPGPGDGNSALNSAAQTASFGECLVDVKDIVKSLFKATARILTVKENCDGEHERHCAHNALKIVAAFSGMGEYLSGAIGRCSPGNAAHKALREGAECGEEAMKLVRHLHNVGRAGVDLGKYCAEGEERLYQLEHGTVEVQSASGGSVTLFLAALLPISAVLSFVGGSRFAKARTTQPSSDSDLLMQEE